MNWNRKWQALGLVASTMMALSAQPALAQEDFYAGRTIYLNLGTAPGGLFDIAARTVANHMPRFIPGEPVIVVQNFPGGWINVANRLHSLDEGDDGTYLAFMQRTEPLWRLQGVEGVNFDPTELQWLGALSDYARDAYFLTLNADHPAQTAEDLIDHEEFARLGSLNPFSSNHIFAVLAREALEMNVEVVSGYPGAAPIFLAMEQDEVDGQLVDLSALQSGQPEPWNAGAFRPLVQFGRAERHPDFPDVPTGRELAPNAEILELIEFAEQPFLMTMPIAASPRIPPDRLETLRNAFMAMVEDPDFIADAERAGLVLSPVPGERILEIVRNAAETPPEVVERYNTIVGVPGS